MVLLAALAPLVTPYGFDAIDLANRRAAPSLAHWFGTDELGRDLFTRVVYGARISLAIGIMSAAVSVAIGIAVGGTAAHYCLTNALRVADAMVVIPLDFLRIPLIAFVGWTFYAERLDLLVFVGAAIIVAGIMWNLRAEMR